MSNTTNPLDIIKRLDVKEKDMNAINFIELFKEGTNFILFDDYNEELYSGDGRRCMAWLMKNNQYDIFPEQGGWWVETHEDAVLIYLTKIFE